MFFEAVFEHRLHAQILDVSTACDLQTYSKTCRELNLGALHAQNSGGHWACLEICTEHQWFAFDIPLELSNQPLLFTLGDRPKGFSWMCRGGTILGLQMFTPQMFALPKADMTP